MQQLHEFIRVKSQQRGRNVVAFRHATCIVTLQRKLSGILKGSVVMPATVDSLKDFVRRLRPKYAKRRNRIKSLSTQEVFTDIYTSRHWGEGISVSGKGSTPEATQHLAASLPKLLREMGVRSIVDAPCGDFSWMKNIDLGVESYVGLDIVEPIVEQLRADHESDHRSFGVANLLDDDLPACDMVFCRDCMLHLSFHDQRKLLKNFRRTEAKWYMMSTYPGAGRNRDIVTGEARPVDLTLSPIGLPQPEHFVEDRGDGLVERGMGVWTKQQLDAWAWNGY
ncbi:MAG: class I SAM-dependent methyltransferase [Planctomycetota bacterium]